MGQAPSSKGTGQSFKWIVHQCCDLFGSRRPSVATFDAARDALQFVPTMGNPAFAFRYARPCRTVSGSPNRCCIFRVKCPLIIHQQRKRAASAAAVATATATAPALDPDPAPEAPKPEEAAKSVEEAKPAEGAPKAPFTPAEDIVLLSLKAQNKPWKDIGEVLVGRDKDELKNRYKDIGGANGGEGGEADKEGASAGQPNEGKGNKGKQQKGDWGKKGKGKQEETKAEEKKVEPGTPAGPATASANANEAVVADRKDAKVKGILRRGSDGALTFGEATIPDGATTLDSCPIIYLEENDPLDIDEVSHRLSLLHRSAS